MATNADMPDGIAHGGRLIEARHVFPGAPAPFIDLSTGINPHPYTLAPFLPELFTRLPEPEMLQALMTAAAGAYKAADASMVVAAPGTQILISLLPRLLGLRRATLLGPTYAEHDAAWRAAGADTITVEQPDAFVREAVRRGGAAILCNPNNPDGRRCAAAMLLELAARLARSGGVLICDEAFADLETPDPGLAPHLPHPGLLILRSFGKSYGLAGLRLGFLLASPAVAARVRGAFGPWAVSGPALAAGCAALADADWRRRMCAHLQNACDRLDAMLVEAGLGCVGGTRLFRLFRGAGAPVLFQALGNAGILTRRFGHTSDLLRLGLPGAAWQWTRLRTALAEP